MERPRRRPKPAAIDITWVSCRGVRSSLPFHTPCLYASVSVTPSSASPKNGRPHRVKTPTDRAGGENPEWDAPLRLYLPDPDASPPPVDRELEAGKNKNRKDGGDDVLLVRFELKAEVAVLGDVLAASATVPVPDLVADGRTRRVSYQLVGPDGRQPNGVISFSYTFHQQRNDDDDHHHHQSGDGELVVAPPCPTVSSSSPVAQPLPMAAAPPRLYPAIEWPLMEGIPIYHTPVAAGAAAVTLANSRSRYCPPPPPPATPVEVEPVAVYPPAPETTSSCSMYPSVLMPASAMYPPVDLTPVMSCYPPVSPTPYSVECPYGAAPRWGDRCLYG